MLLAGGICVMGAMNDMAAPSVSLEGKNIWVVQSLPVPAWYVLRAKLTMHLLLAGAAVLGLSFGVIPAAKAAGLPPAQALRTE